MGQRELVFLNFEEKYSDFYDFKHDLFSLFFYKRQLKSILLYNI